MAGQSVKPPLRFFLLVALAIGVGLWVDVGAERRPFYDMAVVYVALCVGTAVWRPRRLPVLLLGGMPLLLLIEVLKAATPFLLALPLGDLARIPILVVHAALNALPGMMFALPGLLWLTLLGAGSRVTTLKDDPGPIG